MNGYTLETRRGKIKITVADVEIIVTDRMGRRWQPQRLAKEAVEALIGIYWPTEKVE
jgi:hypothetical protein